MVGKDNLILPGIKHYLQSQCYIKGLSVNDKRHIRKRSKDFTFVNGELYFIQRIVCDGVMGGEGTTEYDHLRKVLMRDADKLRAVTEHHIAENGSHNGFDKTCRGVKMAYYWLGIPAYVRNTMKTCPVCIARRNDTEKLKVELDNPETEEEDYERVGVDELETSLEQDIRAEELDPNSHFWNSVEIKILGPFEIRSEKSCHVCIVIDTYSKWSEIQVLQDLSTKAISKFIFHLICRYGIMKMVYMEDDRVNINDIITLLNNTLSSSIDIVSTSCLDSLWNQMINDLESFVKNHPEDWYRCLDIFLIPFRLTNIHNNQSAVFLAHGRGPELPSFIDSENESPTTNLQKLVEIHKTFGQEELDDPTVQSNENDHCLDPQSGLIEHLKSEANQVQSQTEGIQNEDPEDAGVVIYTGIGEVSTDAVDESNTDASVDATDDGTDSIDKQAPVDSADTIMHEDNAQLSDDDDNDDEDEPLEDLPLHFSSEAQGDIVAEELKEVTISPVTRSSRKRGRTSDLNTSSDQSDQTPKSKDSTVETKAATEDTEQSQDKNEEVSVPRRSRRSQVFNKKVHSKHPSKVQAISDKSAKVKKESNVMVKNKDSAVGDDAPGEEAGTDVTDPQDDSDDDKDYIPEDEDQPSPVSNTRRSLRGVKQDWSCLLKKRKLPMKSSPAKKAKTEKVQISVRSRSSSKSDCSRQKFKTSTTKEDNDQDISISAPETEEYYNGVKYYLEKQLVSGKIKTNCRAITNFRLENDHLYYQATPKHREKEIIISEEERVRLMARAHVDDEGTHLCKRKVIDCISAMEYYWRGLTLDCEAFVRACPQCNNGDIRKVETVENDKTDLDKSKDDDDDDDDDDSVIIKQYLDHKTYPKYYDKKKKTTLRRKAANYVLMNGLLYYQYRSTFKPRLCLFTSEEKRKAIKDAHIVKESGQHLGLNKTQDIVKTEYYWIGQTNDVYKYISQCCLVTEKLPTESKTTKQAIDDRIDKFTVYFNDGSLDEFIKKKETVTIEDNIIESTTIVPTTIVPAVETSDIPNNSSLEVRELAPETESKEVESVPIQDVIEEPKQAIGVERILPISLPIKIEKQEPVPIPATPVAFNNSLESIPAKCSTITREFKTRTSIDVNPDNASATKSSWHECNICKTVFSGKVAYKFHMMRHSGTKPFLCNYCNKGFTSVKAKQLHHRKHTGDQPYLCNICARGFERKEGLKYHLKAHEKGGGVPVICDICNRSFQTLSRLKVHKACKHPEIQPTFACQECQKIFSSKRSLKRHFASTHLQEKNYVCNYCSRAFARKEYLHKHIVNQHTKTGETVSDTQIKIEGDHSAPILQYIDAAALVAQLTETGEVTIQGDIVLNEADIPVINDNNTVVFTGDSVQYEVECLTSEQAMVADDQAIQLLVQASLQSQQLQIQQQQLELQQDPETVSQDFQITHEVAQPE